MALENSDEVMQQKSAIDCLQNGRESHQLETESESQGHIFIAQHVSSL